MDDSSPIYVCANTTKRIPTPFVISINASLCIIKPFKLANEINLYKLYCKN